MSAAPATRLACAACGAAADAPFTWRCPAAGRGDDLDHLMVRTLDPARVRFPGGEDTHPFVRYRELLHSWQVAHAAGMPDTEYLARVSRLTERCRDEAGRSFAITPFARDAGLSARLGMSTDGGVWVKDETANVAGSHKARHLMGLALDLEVMEWLDPARRADHDRGGLAIASCGNAALAAAVVAHAGDHPLTVFIPTGADAAVVARIERLGARITTCPRAPGQRGDPTMDAFRRAVAAGAIPFCCQGSENGLTIEGGETLAWEMVSALAASGSRLDRLFVQVGGGALASACVQGLREAVGLGVIGRMPRIHAVQAEGGFPLVRAYRELRTRILAALGGSTLAAIPEPGEEAKLAHVMWCFSREPQVMEALDYARRHRSEFMSPWETAPHSLAHGILDDETYDWLAVVRGMIDSDGFPVVVSEGKVREAHRLAREATGIPVDPTGTAGLAGLLELRGHGVVRPEESVAVLFTGRER
ncbi:MAG: pyridoxal-phosphate dependent enzyme [Candidatus Eisenbacteria bacterium]